MNKLIDLKEFQKNVSDIDDALKYIDGIVGNDKNEENIWVFSTSQQSVDGRFNYSTGKGTVKNITILMAKSLISSLFETDNDIESVYIRSNEILDTMHKVFLTEIHKKLQPETI